MFISPRTAQFRNLALALTNEIVTLVILLIALLGLAAVIINTALVALATYGTGTIADRLIQYLQSGSEPRNTLRSSGRAQLEERDR
ncbi:MAG: CRISPR-associated protein Csx18 [Pseudanabaenaceae cyanobacterium]